MSTPALLSFVALWVIVLFQGCVLIGLLRTVYRLNRGQLAEPFESGSLAPAFVARDVRGEEVRTADLRGASSALLFVSPSCQTCGVVLADLSPLTRRVGGQLVIVCGGSAEECTRLTERYELTARVIADTNFAISRLYRVQTVPTGILIGPHGQIERYGSLMDDATALEGELARSTTASAS
jgi:peroxiredoxin